MQQILFGKISSHERLLTKVHCIMSNKSCREHSLNMYPASKGLFPIVLAELTGTRKRDLCPGSKKTLLSMRHGYLQCSDRTIT